jgi:hypothetical protein
MNSDPDKFWNDVAGKLRKAKGLCPLTPTEAEAAFDDAPEVPLSAGEIDAIVESVTSGDPASWEPVSTPDWEADPATDDIAEQALQLHRNKGDEDPETDRIEQELEEELLNDDEPEEDET